MLGARSSVRIQSVEILFGILKPLYRILADGAWLYLRWQGVQYCRMCKVSLGMPAKIYLIIYSHMPLAIGQGPIGTCLGLPFQFAGKGKVLENLQEISRFALRLSISMSLKSSKSFTRQHHSQIREMLFKTAQNPS